MKILIVCTDCRGSGLYQGFMEKPGHPVICVHCKGTGAVKFQFTPFTKRKLKRGVKSVSVSQGSFLLTGAGPKPGTEMSYKDFLKKVKPPKVKK